MPFPSIADFLYLGAYPPMVVALFLLTRDRGPRDLARLLDTAVIATGLGLVYWVFIIGPIVADRSTWANVGSWPDPARAGSAPTRSGTSAR